MSYFRVVSFEWQFEYIHFINAHQLTIKQIYWHCHLYHISEYKKSEGDEGVLSTRSRYKTEKQLY